MRQTNNTPRNRGHAWLLAVYALVALMMLIAILFGAFIYQDAFQSNQRYSQLRSVEGFIAATLKAGDYAVDVQVSDGPEGDMLRIADVDPAFETCIYLYGDKLVQEYKKVGLSTLPAEATPVAELGSFEAEVDGATVTVRTDIGTFTNTLRSGSGAKR